MKNDHCRVFKECWNTTSVGRGHITLVEVSVYKEINQSEFLLY